MRFHGSIFDFCSIPPPGDLEIWIPPPEVVPPPAFSKILFPLLEEIFPKIVPPPDPRGGGTHYGGTGHSAFPRAPSAGFEPTTIGLRVTTLNRSATLPLMKFN